ncbi:MAG: hypothetical protein ACOYMF_06145 [Bacteroidales bacterium]
MSNFIHKDNDGEITVSEKGIITLHLYSENRQRHIGSLARNKAGYVSYYKQEKESDTFRKLNAWSINWIVLSSLENDLSTVNIKTEKCIYRIQKQMALTCGQFLYFKQTGIEKKFYIGKQHFITESL